MSHIRKTIEVAEVVNLANQFLLNSHDDLKAERQGVAHFIENIMHRNGCYAGFGYIYAHHMENSVMGKSVGIIFDEVGLKHQYPDDSRRIYSIHHALKWQGS